MTEARNAMNENDTSAGTDTVADISGMNTTSTGTTPHYHVTPRRLRPGLGQDTLPLPMTYAQLADAVEDVEAWLAEYGMVNYHGWWDAALSTELVKTIVGAIVTWGVYTVALGKKGLPPLQITLASCYGTACHVPEVDPDEVNESADEILTLAMGLQHEWCVDCGGDFESHEILRDVLGHVHLGCDAEKAARYEHDEYNEHNEYNEHDERIASVPLPCTPDVTLYS